MKQNYLFHRNLQFQKFIKTSPSVLPGCGTRIKLICTPANRNLTRNLITSIIINILFNYIKRLFFYYLRYPHDIRMKYCGCGYGCGCQNSCGYPRMRIRMRSSDTPLIEINGERIDEIHKLPFCRGMAIRKRRSLTTVI